MMCVQTAECKVEAAVAFDCFMWVTLGVLGRSGGERTFFMQAIKGRKTMPLRCDFMSRRKSLSQSYVVHVYDIEPMRKVVPHLLCATFTAANK